ncbi:MAG: hypothetical protein EDX89_14415 [Acidobacteria bacterium]|nr:MAG: hypothetical protein EDX89_14415 [Acidobacteriota bacterium]MCE7957627.1 hypothetical protein [Acidobacteria bacterium ACB2]
MKGKDSSLVLLAVSLPLGCGLMTLHEDVQNTPISSSGAASLLALLAYASATVMLLAFISAFWGWLHFFLASTGFQPSIRQIEDEDGTDLSPMTRLLLLAGSLLITAFLVRTPH